VNSRFVHVIISFKGVNGNPFTPFFTGTIVAFRDKKIAGQYKFICTVSKADLEEEIIKYCVVNNVDIIIVEHEIHSELFGRTDVILLMP
jgi:hypothetical protein